MPIRFGRFTLNEGARQISCAGRAIRLSPKAFDLLALLIHQRPAVTPKAQIHKHLWPNAFVTDGSVAVLVTELRNALGDDGRRQEFIRTVPRHGYAFAAAAIDLDETYSGSDASPCWLAWDAQRFPLRCGENIVGREPTVTVCIDAVGVSRRHALIVISEDEVELQDLASKNGIFVNDVRMSAPIRLTDGMEIRLGPVTLRFRQPAGIGPTQTYLDTPGRAPSSEN